MFRDRELLLIPTIILLHAGIGGLIFGENLFFSILFVIAGMGFVAAALSAPMIARSRRHRVLIWGILFAFCLFLEWILLTCQGWSCRD